MYDCPEGVDEYTRSFIEMMKACASSGQGNILTVFTKEDFQSFWKKCNDCTSSSILGLHYGHYKAAADNDHLSKLHTIQMQVITKASHSLAHWHKGLSCMLENVMGVIVVDKLWAILLMEADFNTFNGIIFAKCMINQVEEQGWIPLECCARQDHEAIKVGLNQKLALNISQLCHQPMAISSVDATQCYNHMAHNTSSICVQWWEVDPIMIGIMLLMIQLMEFYLHMAFCDSMECFSHRETPLATRPMPRHQRSTSDVSLHKHHACGDDV